MEDTENIILLLRNFIENFSWEVLTTTVVGLLIALFKNNEKAAKVLNWIKKNVSIKNSEPKITESQVINHQLFNYINFWLHNKIPTLSFRTEYRNIVFRKYLKIFYSSHYKILKDYVKSEKYKGVDIPTIEKQMVRIVTDITVDYEKTMLSEGIPDVIVSKMKIVLKRDLELLINLIQKISVSPVYDGDDNLLRVYSFLNVVNSILESTITNIIEVCDSINGELAGLSMGGKTEPFKDSE